IDGVGFDLRRDGRADVLLAYAKINEVLWEHGQGQVFVLHRAGDRVSAAWTRQVDKQVQV
ncbi:hypothetical protein, partial [Pseudomonas viridiflava]|uniref:hypothetical protein n=1 Tax=Pseudomonas viridiflava TaxID=33069 RepID=UPI0019D26064